MGRLAAGLGGIVMIIDALISIAASTDRRPSIQAGRVFRAAVGLTLGTAALIDLKDR